ncbi:MAG: ankyrin repeat domain-containing protein [Rhodoferax sp.]|uniref:ankyrin repeat domain-containing protein n=1 Tax=Rhodoferax sp. TaxID=50421 RepID=UPI0018338295|nr:ankyrin repeat domain-containing protein [Rhodoferax sp.]NMM11915.1 ankyrin repeat domain-containing protein [Rhodoferax sp.]
MTITTYSIKGPLFKLALEHGKDPEKFVSAKKQYGPIQVPRDIGEKITMAQIKELVKSGSYQWCGYSDQWRLGARVGWIVGVDETGMDFARISAPNPNELGEMRKDAIADAALASGGKKAVPKTLVKSLVEAIRAGDEESVQRLAPLGARGTFEEKNGKGSTDFVTRRPLVEAAISPHPRMLGIVIPHADIEGEDGNTALEHAVNAEQIANVRALLDAGAKANHANSSGSTPLMAAAQLETRDILDLLLPVSDVNAQEEYYDNTALMLSIKRRRLENVKALLPVSDLAARNKEGLTALMIAVDTLNLDEYNVGNNRSIYDCARLVAGACGEIDAVDGEGRTALMRLLGHKGKWDRTVKQSQELIDILIDCGADPNRLYLNGDSMLDVATRDNLNVYFQALLPLCGAQRMGGKEDASLIIAASVGDLEKVRLLSKTSNVKAANSKGTTALLATFDDKPTSFNKSSDRILSFLHLLPDSNVNAQDNEGRTVLMKLVEADVPELFSLTLARSNPNLQDAQGKTALMHAVESLNEFFFDQLLPISDLSLQDKDGLTALMYSSKSSWPERVAALLAGSNIDHQGNDGCTALMHAVNFQWRVDKEIIDLLLDIANARLKNKAGLTAAQIAEKNKKKDIAAQIAAVALSQEEHEEMTKIVGKPAKRKKARSI